MGVETIKPSDCGAKEDEYQSKSIYQIEARNVQQLQLNVAHQQKYR